MKLISTKRLKQLLAQAERAGYKMGLNAGYNAGHQNGYSEGKRYGRFSQAWQDEVEEILEAKRF